jgi:hypothetical protein
LAGISGLAFWAGNLRWVGQLVDVAAGDQQLEDGSPLGAQNGGEHGAMGIRRESGVHQSDAAWLAQEMRLFPLRPEAV